MILVGHSDGASIALIAAAAHSIDLVGIGVLAPHAFVEDRTLAAIAAIRRDYLGADDLRHRLGRYHRDPDIAFWGWNDVWLTDAFRSWDITPMLGCISVPVVAVQGLDDPYGSTGHVEAIESRVQGPLSRGGPGVHRPCPPPRGSGRNPRGPQRGARRPTVSGVAACWRASMQRPGWWNAIWTRGGAAPRPSSVMPELGPTNSSLVTSGRRGMASPPPVSVPANRSSWS